jgi:hypothetical protein
MLLGVVSLMAGSTTGVPMSPGYGGYQTATPPPYYPKATYATTSYCTEISKYYTTKTPEFYTTTYAAPSHSTDALKYYSAPSYYTTKATEHDYACCPILLHRGLSITLFSATYCTDFPIFCCQLLHRGSRRSSTTLPRSTQPQLRRPRMTQF